MAFTVDQTTLEHFDDLFVGEPVHIETNLQRLLPQALALEQKSIYLQILSQIALAQALQKEFAEAHATLDGAEKLLALHDDALAYARIQLERGRIFWQAGDSEAARPLFLRSYELCRAQGFESHACNAAHLIAIIAPNADEKIAWNLCALELAENSSEPRARAWQGSLYHNIGHAYLERGEFEKALQAFQTALKYREQEGVVLNVCVAKWSLARALRCMHRHDEALEILLPLSKECDVLMNSDTQATPKAVVSSARGLVYEELALIFSAKAYRDLSQDVWFEKLEPQRLERLKRLSQTCE